MTPDDLVQRLEAGGCGLTFDTNAVFGPRRLVGVCDKVQRLNQKLTGKAPVRLTVSTIVHAEKTFDLKQSFKNTFDAKVIAEGLTSKGIVLEPFGADHAIGTADRLGTRYPDTAAWHLAKRKRCLTCVGLRADMVSSGTGKKCGATVDWLIGGYAQSAGLVLVTDDTGPEFVGLCERVTFANLEAALASMGL